MNRWIHTIFNVMGIMGLAWASVVLIVSLIWTMAGHTLSRHVREAIGVTDMAVSVEQIAER